MELGLGLANKHWSPLTWSNLRPVSWGSAAKVSLDLLLNSRITWGKIKSQSQHLVLVIRPFSEQEAQCHCTVSHKASFSQRLLCLMREARDCRVQLSSVTNHWKSSFHSGEYTTQYSVCPLQMLTVPRHRRQEANSQI